MASARPYAALAPAYDALYDSMFDAEAEAVALHELIESRRPGARDLLDVACGTGRHLAHLRRWYRGFGVDVEPEMLRQARRRLPGVPLVRSDLLDLDLRRRFDVATCLFSSIAYVRTPARLRRAIARLARHVRPGGLLIVDGWIRPELWTRGYVHCAEASAGGVTVVRVSVSGRRRSVSTMDWHLLIARDGRVDYRTEHHELALFTNAQYLEAFAAAGLTAELLPAAADGRDRYVAEVR